jgi:hypothetical protein
MLIVGVIPFVISFVIAFLIREPAGYAALQGVGSFALTAMFGMLLVGKQSDEQMETWREQLVRELPMARDRGAARRQQAAAAIGTPIQKQTKEEPSQPIRKVAHPLVPDRQQIVVQVQQAVRMDRRKSSALAAFLELFFGFFFGTFGVGHFYAGSVGVGLFLLLGWWFFLFVNAVLAFFSCGIWLYAAIILIPVPWFFLLILSPILASERSISKIASSPRASARLAIRRMEEGQHRRHHYLNDSKPPVPTRPPCTAAKWSEKWENIAFPRRKG